MSYLQLKAETIQPIDKERVQGIHDMYVGSNSFAAKIIRELCESHERLRMELEGATKMLDEAKPAR